MTLPPENVRTPGVFGADDENLANLFHAVRGPGVHVKTVHRGRAQTLTVYVIERLVRREALLLLLEALGAQRRDSPSNIALYAVCVGSVHLYGIGLTTINAPPCLSNGIPSTYML